MKRMLVCLVVGMLPVQVWAATLSGFVTDESNGETLPYASIVLRGLAEPIGALSNGDGY